MPFREVLGSEGLFRVFYCLGSFRYMGPFGFFQGRFGLGPRVVWVYFELTTDGILTMTLNEPTTLKNPLPKTPRACDPLLSRLDLGPKSDLGPKLCSFHGPKEQTYGPEPKTSLRSRNHLLMKIHLLTTLWTKFATSIYHCTTIWT